MLSITEAASLLNITPARARKLASTGALDAIKIGRAWAVREESVYDRISKAPSAGRPKSGVHSLHPHNAPAACGAEQIRSAQHSDRNADSLHELYLQCKNAFKFEIPLDILENADSREEAGFYIAVADFFLQQKQRELVEQGVY